MRHSAFTGGLVIALVAFSGCGGSNSGLPGNPQTVPQTGGEYIGTAADSAFGNGTAAVTLSQTASSIGGTLTETFGSTTISNALAITISFSGDVSGNGVATVNGASCGFNVTGAYDPATGALTGKYASYSGCSGQTGSFTLTQQCTDPTNVQNTRRRPEGGHGILPC
ncbi:MAG TPA: hypothetical protein VGN11_10510 [Candidatus Baltobacteraceae bacterium]|jgi:hypothetical protein|nr:hypothetical protein [Candidatus Baltobacteraceae bacterium]